MKKAISLILICCMVVLMLPCTPAEAVPEPASVPTIEEILNDYHAKAFAAQTTGETASTSAYSRSVGSNEASLEQETVNTLTAAGYEAYNLTGDNYDSLESQLKTDFSEMGLDPDSSYIIVISGEDQPAETTPINRTGGASVCGIGDGGILPPIHEYDPDQPTGGESFYYTYNGTTYLMRYVTVTAASSDELQNDNSFPLKPIYDRTGYTLLNILDTFLVAFIDKISEPMSFGTLLSLAFSSNETINYSAIEPNSLSVIVSASWTCNYIQVWNVTHEIWETAQCSEYASSLAYCAGSAYDPVANKPVPVITQPYESVVYSSKYNNPAQRKLDAMEAYDDYKIALDCIYSINFYLGNSDGEIVIDSDGAPLVELKRTLALVLPPSE